MNFGKKEKKIRKNETIENSTCFLAKSETVVKLSNFPTGEMRTCILFHGEIHKCS